jgi:heavy metal sensor kinase
VAYRLDGTAYAKTTELAASSVPPVPDAVEAGRYADRSLPIIGRQRSLVSRLAVAGQKFTVLFLVPLEEVDRELGQLSAALVMAVPAALVLAGASSYLLARKALGPLQELHRLAGAITADSLDRRLPIANTADELGRLTETINGMIGRLERSFREVHRFTADASHELRTPLTAIRTEAEVALGKPLPADCRQVLGSILEECERLTRLIDQLLLLAREDARAARAHAPVDLATLLASVVETMRPLAEAKGLRLEYERDGPAATPGDETRLRQVFYNLLDNAIKYTPAGGTVAVALGRQRHANRVVVRDSGIGIPPEHLPHVFNRFYRVDQSRSRELGGTGLGLSIARGIILAHGGDIELTSAPGEGTTCAVTLPGKGQPPVT